MSNPPAPIKVHLQIEIDSATGRAHIVLKKFSNHVMRDILTGLWLTLEADDRREHIEELKHYSEPGSRPAWLSQFIAMHIKEAQSR